MSEETTAGESSSVTAVPQPRVDRPMIDRGVEVGVSAEIDLHEAAQTDSQGLDGLGGLGVERLEVGVERLEVTGEPAAVEGPQVAEEPAPPPVTRPTLPVAYAGSDPLGRATVLIVGVNYAPETAGIAPHTTALARNLAGLAERVVVFTGIPRDPAGILQPIYRRTRRTYGQDGGVQVVRHRHHVPSRRGGLGRARYEASFARATMKTPLRHVPDLVIGVTPSVGGADAASRLARRYGVPLMLVVQDLTSGSGRRRGLVNGAIAWREAVALRRAARVIIVSQQLRGAITELGVDNDRIERLSTGNLNTPLVLDRAAARARLGWPATGFLVVYNGNMGEDQDVPTLVRAARRLASRSHEIRFVLVGDGSQRQALQSAAGDLRGLRFLDPISATDYPALLAAADVLVLNERPGQPDRTLLSKLNSYLSAGRPVIAAVNPGGETERAVRSVRSAATAVQPGDAQALAAAVARLRDEPEERERMSAAARRLTEAASTGTTSAHQRLRDIAGGLLRVRSRVASGI